MSQRRANSRISPERSVRLEPREIGILRWDDQPTLETGGSHSAVRDVAGEAADNVVTIDIAGDVVDDLPAAKMQ